MVVNVLSHTAIGYFSIPDFIPSLYKRDRAARSPETKVGELFYQFTGDLKHEIYYVNGKKESLREGKREIKTKKIRMLFIRSALT